MTRVDEIIKKYEELIFDKVVEYMFANFENFEENGALRALMDINGKKQGFMDFIRWNYSEFFWDTVAEAIDYLMDNGHLPFDILDEFTPNYNV